MTKLQKSALLAAPVLLAGLFMALPAQGATCIGSCGSNAGVVDGDVVPSPVSFGKYDWVSTFGGQSGAAQIGSQYSFDATNGSELISDSFFGAAGQQVSFWFNYITSDGTGMFADYGFAQLVNVNTNEATNLFTARTHPTASIVPGDNMPPLGATLSPGTVTVLPGLTNWSPLGGSSGNCYNGQGQGCGQSGWVFSSYTIEESATYQLRFGAANWGDQAFDSGLAFSGLLLDGATIGDGSARDNPLLPGEIGPNGEFTFEFEVTNPQQVVWIDPEIAIGYEYKVLSGPNILSAIFPELGDADGYQIFLLSDLINPIGTVMANTVFNFGPGGVDGFVLMDIEVTPALNPLDAGAFVTGLTFNVASGPTTINMTQTPITVFVQDGVPEPGTWAMMIAGFALVGSAMRRRKVSISFA